MEKYVEAILKKFQESSGVFDMTEMKKNHYHEMEEVLQEEFKQIPLENHKRLWSEFFGEGPLQELLNDNSVSEILINDSKSIWYEQNGELHFLNDRFFHDITYQNFVDRICIASNISVTFENPAVYGKWKTFRVTVIHSSITAGSIGISFRRHPVVPWKLDVLQKYDWANSNEISILRSLIHQRKNMLIVGPTGSGKTSVLNALLSEIPNNQRIISIEDASEIQLPSTSGLKLLTRQDLSDHIKELTPAELLKYSLRLRPDRIVMGEIRFEEAKDFILTLSTGHAGSLATLHADNPHQALFRLEMLVQMGAPQWSLQTIRRMIWLSLNCIIVCQKEPSGKRSLKGIYKITSLEESGFLLEEIEVSLEESRFL